MARACHACAERQKSRKPMSPVKENRWFRRCSFSRLVTQKNTTTNKRKQGGPGGRISRNGDLPLSISFPPRLRPETDAWLVKGQMTKATNKGIRPAPAPPGPRPQSLSPPTRSFPPSATAPSPLKSAYPSTSPRPLSWRPPP